MPAFTALARNHVEYTIWATGRLLETARGLSPDELNRDFGTADKSVLGTFAHLQRSELLWMRRLHGDSSPATIDKGWQALQDNWPALHAQWREWVAGRSEAEMEIPLDYTDLRGNQWSQPLWQIILHVVNHATHHRGQISGFLRALGQTPPPLDFVAFMRLQR